MPSPPRPGHRAPADPQPAGAAPALTPIPTPSAPEAGAEVAVPATEPPALFGDGPLPGPPDQLDEGGERLYRAFCQRMLAEGLGTVLSRLSALEAAHQPVHMDGVHLRFTVEPGPGGGTPLLVRDPAAAEGVVAALEAHLGVPVALECAAPLVAAEPTPQELPRVVCRRVRNEPGVEHLAPPRVSECGSYVSICYNMRRSGGDAAEVQVSGGNVRDLATGYAVDVPAGWSGVVSVRQTKGDWSEVLRLYGAMQGELVVPYRNFYHSGVLRAQTGAECARLRLQPLLRCALEVRQ